MKPFWLFLLSILSLNCMQGQTNLEQHQWKNRVLLFFTPSDNPTDWQTQQRILAKDKNGLQERDLLTYQIKKGEQLWEKYNVPSDQFTVILIGKDGGEKLRQEEPLSLDKLYAIIDAMPMRRSEMRRQRQ